MGVRSESRPALGADTEPPAFTEAVASMRAVTMRPEMHLEPMPAPQRIAPYAAAVSADLDVDGEEIGTGRLILLHDPAGNEAWDGQFRCVAYARADIEAEMITDPVLADVGWAWLTEALERHGADHRAISGTVTRVATENYGGMAEDGGSAQIEVRASWTPVGPLLPAGGVDAGLHAQAWGELMSMAAGLPPVPDGVSLIAPRRSRGG
jgi:hypothetical protein